MAVSSVTAVTQAAPARTAEPKNTGGTEPARNTEAGSGSALPQGGPDLPSSRQADAARIAAAAERLQEIVRESARSLDFHVDETSGRTVITVINEATGEVIRQIPAEEVLALARSLGTSGALVDSEA